MIQDNESAHEILQPRSFLGNAGSVGSGPILSRGLRRLTARPARRRGGPVFDLNRKKAQRRRPGSRGRGGPPEGAAPGIELLWTEIVPACHRSQADTLITHLGQQPQLVLVRPGPPPLSPRQALQPRHRPHRFEANCEISFETWTSAPTSPTHLHRTLTSRRTRQDVEQNSKAVAHEVMI